MGAGRPARRLRAPVQGGNLDDFASLQIYYFDASFQFFLLLFTSLHLASCCVVSLFHFVSPCEVSISFVSYRSAPFYSSSPCFILSADQRRVLQSGIAAKSLCIHCIVPFAFASHTLRYRCAFATQSLLIRCAIASESLRNRCAIASESLRNRCGIAAESLRNCCAIASESLRNRFGIATESPRNRCAIASESLRNSRGISADVAAESLRNRFGIAAELLRKSLRNRSTIAAH
jgi:hypothetical protein